MKTENEKLKEIFTKNFGRAEDTPDFETMWQIAARANKRKKILAWKIAASIAVIVTAGTMVILRQPYHKKDGSIQITSWREPTKILLPWQTDGQLTTLTHWTSPTSFLLPNNHQPVK
jgi:hypothetical protein